MNGIVPSLRKQLAEAEENLRLIQEQMSKFVLYEDIPLQLVKNERQRKAEIANLKARLESLKKGECPYRGLEAFEAKHAAFYYGRDDMVTNLVEQINRSSFVAVIGASGSGKSSLVRAGLIHTLQQSGEAWAISLLTPGRNPLDALSTRLVNWLYPQATEVDRLIEASKLVRSLNDGTLTIQKVLARVLQLHSGSQLLLLVDQFEELFTQDAGKTASERFISLVLEAVELDKGVRVLIAIRADFYAHLLSHPQLAEAVGDGQFNVLPLSDEELQAAIEQPALDMGREFEPGLVERIVDDVAGEPGNLPLLQFALQQLWARQDENGRLTHAAYDKIGGVEQALASYAENIYLGLKDEQTRMQRVLIQLVRPGEGTTDTRRLARRDELGEENWKMVIFLADKRLVVTHGERVIQANTLETEDIQAQTIQTAEVAHEALIQGWKRLRQWMNQDRDFRVWQERLRVALRQWEDNKQDEGALYRGSTLSTALDWAKTHHDQLTEKERLFIDRSKELVEREKAEREAQLQQKLEQEQALREESERRQKITTRLGSIVFIAALLATIFGFQNAELAATNEIAAQENANLAAIYELSSQENAKLAATNEAIAQENVAVASTALAASTKVVEERNEAERQADIATIRQLAAQADAVLDQYPPRNLLLALESLYLTQQTENVHGFVANQTIRNGLAQTKGIPLVGHKDRIYEVAISPDGKWLVTASRDKTVRLWNLEATDPPADPIILEHDKIIEAAAISPDGEWLVTGGGSTVTLWNLEARDPSANPLILHPRIGIVRDVVISADGQWFAAGGEYGGIRLWDLSQPSVEPLILHGHERRISTMTTSFDGQWLITGSADHTVRLWNLKRSDPSSNPLVLRGYKNYIYTVAISRDGQWLVAGGRDHTASLWNLKNPSADPLILRGHEDEIHTAAISPDGQWLVTGSGDHTARLWNLEDPLADPLILRGHQAAIRTVAISLDGQWLVTGSSDSTARRWSLENPWTEPLTLRSHEHGITSMAISPNGQWLVTATWTGRVHLWDLENPWTEPLILRSHEKPISSVAISPDGQWLVTGSADYTARLWDLDATNKSENPLILSGHKNSIMVMAISPDGQWLVTGSRDHTARLWNLKATDPSASPLILRGHEGDILSVAISSDQQWLVTGSRDHTARLWNLKATDPSANSRVLRGHEDDVQRVGISPDGQWLVTSSLDKTVHLWNLKEQSSDPLILRGHEDAIRAMAISPDGQRLVTGSVDQTVRLWDLKNPLADPVILRSHNNAITTTTISPDGQWLVTCDDSGTVIIWNLAAIDPSTDPRILRTHEGRIWSAAISPDGQWLVTGSEDRTARLWNLKEPWADSLILSGHENTVVAVAISPNGQSIITGSWDKTARLWALEDSHLIDQACRYAERNLTLTEWQRYFRGQPYRKTCENWPIHYTVTKLTGNVRTLAKKGQINDAIIKLKEVQTFYPEVEIQARDWNALCWYGSLWADAMDMMDACERAVELAPNEGWIIDSRGLARALTGDYEGAIEDFEVYIEWSKENDKVDEYEENRTQREKWIKELKAGRNPFDAETLEALKD